jgi:predicted site-specific integrase-resolvase
VLHGGIALADVPDPFALVTASEAARYSGVTIEAILNWRRRGHLTIAGTKDGRPAYTLLDVAKAEHATRKRARR